MKRRILLVRQNKTNNFIQQFPLFPVSLLRCSRYKHYFNNVFTTFLGLEIGFDVAVNRKVRKLSDLIKNILICVQKMNEGLAGLERHESEKLMTEFSFLGELTL